MELTESTSLKVEDLKETEYYVPKIMGLRALAPDVHLTVYDLPGLNDSKTKSVYHKYVEKVFHNFDIVVLVLDIMSAMNTSDEMDILQLCLKNMKSNFDRYETDVQLLIVINKCDEMEMKSDGEIILCDIELREMERQLKNIIEVERKRIFADAKIQFCKVSSEDAFIYRMCKTGQEKSLNKKYLNKFGSNEFGKNKWNRMSSAEQHKKIKKIFTDIDYKKCIELTGFSLLINTLDTCLTPQRQFQYLINHIMYKVYEIKDITKDDIKDDVKTLIKLLNETKRLEKHFCQPVSFSTKIKTYVKNYITKVETHNKAFLSKSTASNETEFTKFTYFKKIMDMCAKYFDILLDSSEKIKDTLRDYHLNQLKNLDIEIKKFHILVNHLHEYKDPSYLTDEDGILSKLVTYKKFSESDVHGTIFRYCRRYKVAGVIISNIVFRNIKIQLNKLNMDMFAIGNMYGINSEDKAMEAKRVYKDILSLEKVLATHTRDISHVRYMTAFVSSIKMRFDLSLLFHSGNELSKKTFESVFFEPLDTSKWCLTKVFLKRLYLKF